MTFPPFCVCLVFDGLWCSVYGWNTTKGTWNVICYYFLRIPNLGSWKAVIHWSRECNFVDLFYWITKKKIKIYDPVILQFSISLIHDLQSRDLMVLILVNPVIMWFWSEKNHDPEYQGHNFSWSRDYDPSHTCDHRNYVLLKMNLKLWYIVFFSTFQPLDL